MPHLTGLNLQSHATRFLPKPSDPEASGQSRRGYPPQGLKRPPHPADRNRKICSESHRGSLFPWGRLGHRRQQFPVQLRDPLPQSAQVAVGRRGTPMRMRKRRFTIRSSHPSFQSQ
ncbi:hypothetical protein P7K49_036279 [Saguinus oedipus]|uniref:Uncharacterized protein n=1 Tax=Saguinus oedipus TaxID=9490 RepID=A0ABQ9TJN1_SAGOE|nr:hypothetical protein P7K49_036279 [Saguinus oedipus]